MHFLLASRNLGSSSSPSPVARDPRSHTHNAASRCLQSVESSCDVVAFEFHNHCLRFALVVAFTRPVPLSILFYRRHQSFAHGCLCASPRFCRKFCHTVYTHFVPSCLVFHVVDKVFNLVLRSCDRFDSLVVLLIWSECVYLIDVFLRVLEACTRLCNLVRGLPRHIVKSLVGRFHKRLADRLGRFATAFPSVFRIFLLA